MFRSFLRPALALALVGALAACDSADSGGDGGGGAAAPPTPIALAAFDAGTDAFPDAAASAAGKSAGLTYANAAVRVGVVSTIVGLNLVLPTLATEAATRRAPELVDGAFVWSNTVEVLGAPVDVRLTGDPSGSLVDWTLETAPSGEPFFTFYTARTTLDGRDGDWSLFKPDADGSVLTADFDADSQTDREITFAVPAGNDGAGSEVTYRVDGTTQVFDFTKQPEGTRALIEWDLGTRAGSITADDYNDGERACWDTNLDDVAC